MAYMSAALLLSHLVRSSQIQSSWEQNVHFPKVYTAYISIAFYARCFQILFQPILLKPCKAGIVIPISQMRKPMLGDVKLLAQDHRAHKWQSHKYKILCSSHHITLPLLSCFPGSGSQGSTVPCNHLRVSASDSGLVVALCTWHMPTHRHP